MAEFSLEQVSLDVQTLSASRAYLSTGAITPDEVSPEVGISAVRNVADDTMLGVRGTVECEFEDGRFEIAIMGAFQLSVPVTSLSPDDLLELARDLISGIAPFLRSETMQLTAHVFGTAVSPPIRLLPEDAAVDLAETLQRLQARP